MLCENVSFFVYESIVSWIMCDAVRPQVDGESWQIYLVYVCYFLKSHSVTVDWVVHWFILYKPPKWVRASNSSQR